MAIFHQYGTVTMDDDCVNTTNINGNANDDDYTMILSMVEDCLSEGMILLDPPPTTFFHSSKPCRRKDYEEAYEYLIKACQLLTKLKYVVPTSYGCCCDVYRAMIVCSHHLLPFHHEEEKHVYLDTIRKCLLLLHCLAAQQICTNKKWFESLPTSSYGYLQEYFQPIPMTIQNSHNNEIITIGTHPLPISLSYYDYLPNNYFDKNTKTTTTATKLSTMNPMTNSSYHAFENNKNQEDIMISMDIKQLEKEESQLIDIALPSFNDRILRKKKKYQSSEKDNYILKSNFCMILFNQHVVDDKEEQNHVVKMYSNGLIVIDNNDKSRNYILTTQSKCQPNIQNQHFSIQLENVRTYSSSSSSQESTLQLFISPRDNDDNVLSLGYKWVSTIETILQDIQQSHNKNDNATNQQDNYVQSLLIQEWKMNIWKPIAKQFLQERRQEDSTITRFPEKR